MTLQIDLYRMKQSTTEYYEQDGSNDIIISSGFLAAGVAVHLNEINFFTIIVLLVVTLMQQFKKYIIYPRLGYAKIPKPSLRKY